MTLLLLSHLVAAAVLLSVGARLGRGTIALAAAPMAVAALVLAWHVPSVLDGDEPTQRAVWVGGLDLALSFRMDAFALLLGLVVSVIGVLVLVYASAYFGPEVGPRYRARFAGTFVAFGGAMLGLVLADDIWTLFICWELTSVTSFLLIGLDDHVAAARQSALRALLVTSAGGLAMLGGFVLLAGAAGTTSLHGLLDTTPTGTAFEVGLLLVLLGAFTKSAQVPFHFWLPGAMSAPTPVSAYLHSATMVKAGVVVIARLAPAFATLTWWTPLLVTVGCTTMLVGGLRALRQHDAKLLLAHGTVSQLGFLVVLLGSGIPQATAAGVAVLVAHALFKATLFLCVGVVDHATGSRDLRRLQGVGRDLPLVAACAAVAGLSMAGIPPLLGFVAKEAALDALLEEPAGWATVALVGVVVGSILTVAYTARCWWGVFATKATAPADAATVHHPPSAALLAPIVALTAASIAGGLAASPLGHRLAEAAHALDPTSEGHLTLWAGVHAPLLTSVAIVVLGAAVARVAPRAPGYDTTRWPSGERTYQALLDGLVRGARRVTAVVQNGSLPAYLAVTFVVISAAVGAAVLGGGWGQADRLVAADSAPQALVAVLAAAMALATVAVRRRFTAVLLLGGVGYALALVFLLYGAPDLALTQLLVETLSVVVFLLVLRHLPESYTPAPSWAPQAVRIAIAAAVGASMAALAFMVGTTRTERPVTDEVVARAVPEAGGRNIVNVVIVDFRGVDTLYEITVLGVAIVGVANLVRGAQRASQARTAGLRSAAATAPGPTVEVRSVVFDEVARIVFYVILVVSLYVAFRGHNAPGGGFAGGLIAGAAFTMRYLAGDRPRLARGRLVNPTSLIAVGLLIALATGATGLLDGGQFLQSWSADPHLPLIGTVHVVSAGIFDVGVYVLVLGAVLTVLARLGADAAHGPQEVTP